MCALDITLGFPGGSEVKASVCNVGDLGSIPGSGRSPGEGNGNPLQYYCLENPMDGGAWWATVHGVAQSDTTELLHFTLDITLIKYRFLITAIFIDYQSVVSQQNFVLINFLFLTEITESYLVLTATSTNRYHFSSLQRRGL